MRHRPGLTGLRPTTGCDSYEPPGTGACLDDGRIGRSVKRAAALRSAGPNGARGVDDRPLADRPTFLDYHGAPDKASFAAWIAPSFDPATPSRFAARESKIGRASCREIAELGAAASRLSLIRHHG